MSVMFDPKLVDHNNMYITFYALFDMDLALIRLIKNKYKSDKIFNTKYLDLNYKYMINELRDRIEYNPLVMFIKEEYQSEADDLYNQFMEKEYDNILELAYKYKTSYTNAIAILSKYEELEITILCKDEKQLKFANKYISDYNIDIKAIIYEDTLNYSSFDTIIVRSFKEVEWVGKFECKTLYMSDDAYNNYNIIKEVAESIKDQLISNTVNIVSLYNFNEDDMIRG